MARIRAYVKGLEMIEGGKVALGREESHHLGRVLRVRVGDSLVAFDGAGGEWACTVSSITKSEVVLAVERAMELRERSLRVTLFIGMPKGGVFEDVLRRATELGVSAVVPVLSEHSEFRVSGERLAGKLERWGQILVEGCKQSANPFLPQLHEPMGFADAMRMTEGRKYVASLEGDAADMERDGEASAVSWLVGPEGDFSANEYEMAREAGFVGVSLGENILRVETAVASALSITNYVYKKRDLSRE